MSDSRTGEEEVQDDPGTSHYARKQENAYEARRASLGRFHSQIRNHWSIKRNMMTAHNVPKKLGTNEALLY